MQFFSGENQLGNLFFPRKISEVKSLLKPFGSILFITEERFIQIQNFRG